MGSWLLTGHLRRLGHKAQVRLSWSRALVAELFVGAVAYRPASMTLLRLAA